MRNGSLDYRGDQEGGEKGPSSRCSGVRGREEGRVTPRLWLEQVKGTREPGRSGVLFWSALHWGCQDDMQMEIFRRH